MRPKLFEPLTKLKAPSEGNFYEHCQAGHESHQTTIVQKSLSGQPANASAPAIPEHLGVDLAMAIYDWREYFITVDGNETIPEFDGYCTGQDIISYCIDQQGVWEGDETIVILDILNELQGNHSGIMLDFGSHIGYYSMLAAIKGYQVASMDNSIENLKLLRQSAEINEVSSRVHTFPCWLDDSAPYLNPKEEPVQLMKVDVEGAEKYATMMCTNLFGRRKIKYAIIEVSPVFNDSYPALVERIITCGYKVYQLPGNNWEHNIEFSQAPLKTIAKYCEVTQRGQELAKHINSFSQENFLFVRLENE